MSRRKIFEAHHYMGGAYTTKESADPQACIDVVELAGQGSVTLFLVEPNLPGLLPEEVMKSLAHWRYQDRKWEAISIFTGAATSMGEEKPHL